MKVNKFKLSTTALAISFALASFTSAVSAAVILNTTNYMTGTNPGNWNAASLTYNVPDSWYGSTMCQVSCCRPPRRNYIFAEFYESYQ